MLDGKLSFQDLMGSMMNLGQIHLHDEDADEEDFG